MIAVTELHKHISLNKSLLFIGVSKTKWYYCKSPRHIPTDPVVTNVVQRIGNARPTYGTRRMAAQVSREIDKPVNRKQIQRIFHKLGWIEPAKTKNDIIKSNRTLFRHLHQTNCGRQISPMSGVELMAGVIALMYWMHLAENGFGIPLMCQHQKIQQLIVLLMQWQ